MHVEKFRDEKVSCSEERCPLPGAGVAYYEGEFYNVVCQGRAVPAVPLVLVGVKP
jgi:hypothetical protein